MGGRGRGCTQGRLKAGRDKLPRKSAERNASHHDENPAPRLERDFLAAGSFAVGVGSELIDGRSIAAANYKIITERARKFREAVAGVRKTQ